MGGNRSVPHLVCEEGFDPVPRKTIGIELSGVLGQLGVEFHSCLFVLPGKEVNLPLDADLFIDVPLKGLHVGLVFWANPSGTNPLKAFHRGVLLGAGRSVSMGNDAQALPP